MGSFHLSSLFTLKKILLCTRISRSVIRKCCTENNSDIMELKQVNKRLQSIAPTTLAGMLKGLKDIFFLTCIFILKIEYVEHILLTYCTFDIPDMAHDARKICRSIDVYQKCNQ